MVNTYLTTPSSAPEEARYPLLQLGRWSAFNRIRITTLRRDRLECKTVNGKDCVCFAKFLSAFHYNMMMMMICFDKEIDILHELYK